MKQKGKNVSLVTLATLLALALTACGTTPKSTGTGIGSGSPPPAQTKQIEFIRLDYQGAALGSDVPAWVEAAVNNDLETIKKIPRFNGKVPIVEWGSGQNLDLVRSWVNNFNVSAGLSRRISTYVDADFGGGQLGDKDTPANRNFIKEIVSSFSSTQFSGLAREMDYWIKLRIIDRDNEKATEEYRYYVIYSISESDLQYQIDVAMGKVSAETKAQQEIKNDVEAAMRNTRFNSIQQASNGNN